MWEIYQNSNCFTRYGRISNSNLPKLMKNLGKGERNCYVADWISEQTLFVILLVEN
jgi:hypothetical protein